MIKDEALRLALESLEYTGLKWPQVEEAITAIKAALEANEFNPDWDTQAVLVEEIQRMAKRIEELEAKDEPFEYWNAVEGWVKIDEVRQHFDSVGCGTIYKNAGEDRVPLYTVAQRKWIGLTQQDIDIAFDETQEGGGFDEFARAIEQRLKEKNT